MTVSMPSTSSMPLRDTLGVAAAGTMLPGAATPDTSAATTYTDLNGLAALKRDPNSPEAQKAVAEQVEAMFLQMMLKSMRDASAADDPDGNEMGMYQDMFDKQVALTISQHADLGIGRLLKRQISGKSAPVAPKSASETGSIVQPSVSVAASPAEFVHRMLPSIKTAAASLGVNPLGLMAQAALETGWGQRMPRNADGSPSNNMFGIKAGEGWSGPKAVADTMEVTNGVAAPKRTAFRSYGSIEESVNDFAALLKNSPRYKDALAAGTDAQAYVSRIGGSGYATDPEYGNKLNEILNGDALQSSLTPRIAKL
jgi:peptidoglycan hydrolase FlgJ